MTDYTALASDLRKIAKQIAYLNDELLEQINCLRPDVILLECLAEGLDSDEAEDFAERVRKDEDADARMREDKATKGADHADS